MWKSKSICFCSYNGDKDKISNWIMTRPDLEDSPCPCYFCIIDTDPNVFESEFQVVINELPDIYCPKCKIPRKSVSECLQPACVNYNKIFSVCCKCNVSVFKTDDEFGEVVCNSCM